MRIRENTLFMNLMAHDAHATTSVFEWYGLPADDDYGGLTIKELCTMHGLDADDVITDLQSQLDDDDDDGEDEDEHEHEHEHEHDAYEDDDDDEYEDDDDDAYEDDDWEYYDEEEEGDEDS